MCLGKTDDNPLMGGVPFVGSHSLSAMVFGTGAYKVKKPPAVELPKDRVQPVDPIYPDLLRDGTAALDRISGVHTSARGATGVANTGFVQINGMGSALPAPPPAPPAPPPSPPAPPPPPPPTPGPGAPGGGAVTNGGKSRLFDLDLLARRMRARNVY